MLQSGLHLDTDLGYILKKDMVPLIWYNFMILNCQRQIDLLFGVTHVEHWHSLNMRQNPSHYSAISSLGEWAVSSIQQKFGAGVYYNPYVKINGVDIKYGVISMDKLLRDMKDWESLYIAGRMHKPV